MKRFQFTVLGILLINIIPDYVFAGESNQGLDMNTYGLWVSYGFLVIILLFFVYFLYSSSKEQEEPEYEKSERPVFTGDIINLQGSAILAPLRFISFSIIALIIFYTAIFLLLIT